MINEETPQEKKKKMNLLIYIWMVLRVPVILGILVGFFLLPLIPQPKFPFVSIIQILSLIVLAIGVVITGYSSTILIKNAKFKPPKELNLDPIPQNLVTKGFYKFIRHPIYTGCIVIHLSYCLFFRALFCILFLTPLFILSLFLKARQEERDLKKKFGEAYEDYKKKAGMLFPKIKKQVD